MKRLFAFLLFALPAFGQNNDGGLFVPQVTPVSSLPASCVTGYTPIWMLISTGAVYSCRGGVPTQLGGGIVTTPGGNPSNCQYNDAGAFGGDSGCTYGSGNMTLTGEINAVNGNFSGTVGAQVFYGGPNQTFNVEAFGAKADNSTDATASIQAAITAGCHAAPGGAAPGGYVYFPKGQFIVNSTIDIPCSYITLWGRGATLRFPNATCVNPAFLITPDAYAEQITLSGLTLSGPGTSGSCAIVISNGSSLSLVGGVLTNSNSSINAIGPNLITIEHNNIGFFGYVSPGVGTSGAGIIIPANSSARLLKITGNDFSGLYNGVEIHGNIDGFLSEQNIYSSILNWANISDHTLAGASTTIRNETWGSLAHGGVQVNAPGGVLTIGPNNEFDPGVGSGAGPGVDIESCAFCQVTGNSLNEDGNSPYSLIIGNSVRNAQITSNLLTEFTSAGISVGTSGAGPYCNIFTNNTTYGTGALYSAPPPNCTPNPEPENYALQSATLTTSPWQAISIGSAIAPTVTSCPSCTDPNGNTGTGVYNVVFNLNNTIPTPGSYSTLSQVLVPPGGATAGSRQVWVKSNSGTPLILLVGNTSGCSANFNASATWTLESIFCNSSSAADDLVLETASLSSSYSNISNIQVWDPCATYNNGQCQSPAGLPVVTTTTPVDYTAYTNVGPGVVFGSSFVTNPSLESSLDGTGVIGVTETGGAITENTSGNAATATKLAATPGSATGQAMCWKAAGVPGYCSTVVSSSGACTCN